MSLPTRKLGGKQVNSIGFGAMGLSVGYGETGSIEDRLELLDAVYARGCKFWDTSDAYEDNEELIGKWFAKTGKRKEIFLATKFGLADKTRFPNGDPDYVKVAFEDSLKKLQTDYVDLYYLHRGDPKVPIEKTIAAMAELVKEGKVKAIGVSEISASALRRAHAIHPIAALQVEYSPLCLDVEFEKLNLFATAKELGIAIVAYSPLGRGLLTGSFRKAEDVPEGHYAKYIPRFNADNFPKIVKLADEFAEIGKKHKASSGQVVLAWLLAQGDNVFVIPGTKKVKYLEDNLGAAKVTLTKDEVKQLRTLAEEIHKTAPGERYPGEFNDLSFIDTPALAEGEKVEPVVVASSASPSGSSWKKSISKKFKRISKVFN
ncbi:hypothetical protein HETIRDRAFT_388181 [Heterobasidion irregulare TC 32-1]|uniref:NADP-dependent oxidoreductase domain-containing protein n=1 Tax=Heterobasidion irregulare (strain TC 32-1) TaxID=747525 RepID=W4JYB4_HETIT|nr:uncharacterized protein HETIRDRAFT_388181 [Heterobasidion irregulare TC 32-1]ETW78095.1 hypothetical protein HETIRDRAFT_388181 [Heterobasidion irregulare TC 32-1]